MMHPLPAYAVVLAVLFCALVVALFLGGILASAARKCPRCQRFTDEDDECQCGGDK